MGYRRGEHIHVMRATVPGSLDERRRHSFTRKDPLHQTAATREWSQSNQMMDWVGEWHSHLEPHPSPSPTDLSTWARQVKRQRRRMTYMIVGTSVIWVGLLDWGKSRPEQLREVEVTPATVLFG